jgi:hypothetical protein
MVLALQLQSSFRARSVRDRVGDELFEAVVGDEERGVGRGTAWVGRRILSRRGARIVAGSCAVAAGLLGVR